MTAKKIHPFIVIGGGIIGLSIALALQKAKVNVLLIEQNTIGSGASHGNAGHIATEQVFPIADPSILKQLPKMLLDPLGPLRLDWRYLLQITPWLLRLLGNMRHTQFNAIHKALLELNAHALTTWQDFANTWQITEFLRIQGSLLVTEKTSSQNTLQKHGQYLNTLNIPNEWMDQASLQQMEPTLSNTQIGGLFYPNTGHIVDLDAMLEKLKTAFIQMGGEVLEHTQINQIRVISSQEIYLYSDQKQLYAQNIAIACGAFSKSLTKMVSGIDVPLETERGYHLMLPQETGRLSIPVSSIDRRFIMTPMNQGLRLAGTVEYAGLNLPANMQRAQNFLPLANPMLKAPLNTDQSTQWMGFRPTTSDSLPIIDKKENCYFAFGHQHLGLTQAPITAQMIASMHFDQPMPLDRIPFGLNRFK